MPYAPNGAVSVHYKEWGSSERPALVLVFGFSMSASDWLDFGYINALKNHFRLIAVEPRGHGDSTASNDATDYELSKMAADITAVLDQLRIDRCVLWGYSLGAKIALACAGTSPHRFTALVLGGFELHSEVDLSQDLVAATLAKGGGAWLDLWQRMFTVPAPLAARLRQADTKALLALRQAEATWPDLSEVPATISAQCLLYAGEHCFYRAATEQMASTFPSARYLERPGLNHFSLMSEADWIGQRVISAFHDRQALF